jgi:Restriction endonuclease
MGDWKGFERLAARIARDLRPDATVTWDDHLPGRLSKTSRQIDVSIRWSDADQQYLSIVQAKDWGDPADLVAVGEFASVVEDVGATQGVMACRSGFTRGARNYARSKGIELYNLHDAESCDWRLELTIPLLWVDLLPSGRVTCPIYLNEGEALPLDNGVPLLFIEPGSQRVDPLAIFEQLWNARAIPDTVGVQHHLQYPPMAVPVEGGDGQTRWRTATYTMVYQVGRRAWLGQFTPAECRGLVDYLDDNAFTVSHLPTGQIPVERDDRWVEVDDPDKVAVNVRGAMVTTTGFEITAGSGVVEDATVTTPSGDIERLA